MRYITFTDQEFDHYEICFLLPDLHSGDIRRLYIDPNLEGMEEYLLAYTLEKHSKRTPVKVQKAYLDQLLPILHDLKTRYLVVCDAEYFRTMTKGASAEASLGTVIEGEGDYAGFKILYCPNFRAVFYNPDKVKTEISQALYAMKSDIIGVYQKPGVGIIHHEAYPDTVQDIEAWLEKLLEMDCDLAADIEGFSLKHYDAGIGTISFAWSKHEGIAFAVDLHKDGPRIRSLLLSFFTRFRRTRHTMRWHNIAFDVTVLISQLFMDHLIDKKGLNRGLDVMLGGSWDCTRLITYLATNSCAGNKLGLKHQSLEFAGNYAVEEIKDIRQIPLPKLLRYNLVDSMATWFVFEKHYDRMVADQQLEIYEELFKPSTIDIIQMQLTGLPLNMERVVELNTDLQAFSDEAAEHMQSNAWVVEFVKWQTERVWEKDFQDRKMKAKSPSKIKPKDKASFPTQPLNPNSGPQLQTLLYGEQFMNLPVLDLTDTKAPSTGGDTLKKLRHQTDNPDMLEFLDALIDFKSVEILLTTFLPRFLEAPQDHNGWYWLMGNFNLGGTKSGRLSSSGPNLQNLPVHDDEDSEQKWAKRIKACFQAPPGKLLIGLDFDSLEDRISALTTKDPNKIKVYTDGYDGHCLRAHAYFEDQMPDIVPDDVASINSIKKKYKSLRQDSKVPTFLLTYGGTWMGIIEQVGWPKNKAQDVENKYHELYQVSDDWVADRIREAGDNGYVECAFGLRLRTPLLKQVIRGTNRTPFEAEQEARTAGNALGQSWCLLNSRASVDFMRQVRSSEYSENVWPCAHIHDAQYYVIDDDMDQLQYVNTHLVKAVQWQDDPAIWHDEVKLGGEVSVFHPSWAEEMVVPNLASFDTIKELAFKHITDYAG